MKTATERLADVVAPISEGQISFVSDPAKTFGKLGEYDTYRGQAFDQDTVVLEFVTNTATAAAICREVAVLYSIGVAETKAQIAHTAGPHAEIDKAVNLVELADVLPEFAVEALVNAYHGPLASNTRPHRGSAAFERAMARRADAGTRGEPLGIPPHQGSAGRKELARVIVQDLTGRDPTARIQELLEANNRYLEDARGARRQAHALRKALSIAAAYVELAFARHKSSRTDGSELPVEHPVRLDLQVIQATLAGDTTVQVFDETDKM